MSRLLSTHGMLGQTGLLRYEHQAWAEHQASAAAVASINQTSRIVSDGRRCPSATLRLRTHKTESSSGAS